jgi:hypothetical protein
VDELLKKRIDRALEGLTQDQAYKILDYAEFLQSKYAGRRGPSTLEKIANGVEDTLRVGKVPIAAIKGTREVFNTAERVMRGLADASRSVVDELQGQVTELTKSETKEDATIEPADPDAPIGEAARSEDRPKRPLPSDPGPDEPSGTASTGDA